MNTNTPESKSHRRLLWSAIAGILLVALTVYCQMTWAHRAGHLHGLLAFFVGLLVLLVVNALVRLCVGTWKRSRRWWITAEPWRLCGWTVLFVVSTFALFYAVELWRGKRAWATVVREAKARGESLDYETLFPPQPPDEQNFAMAPLFTPLREKLVLSPDEHSADFKSPPLREIERFARTRYGENAFGAWWLGGRRADWYECMNRYFATPHAAPPPGPPLDSNPGPLPDPRTAAAAFLVKLEPLRGPLDELRKFSERPQCWFPHSDNRPSGIYRAGSTLPGLVNLLSLRAAAELATNHVEAAFEDLQFALRLVDYMRPRHRPWFSGCPALENVLQPLWEGLTEGCWTSAQLATIQAQLARLDLLADYDIAARSDALGMAALVEDFIPTTSARPAQLLFKEEEQHTLEFVRLFYPVGWSLQDQAAIHQFHLQTTSRLLDLSARRIVGERRGEPRGLFSSSDPFFPWFMTPKVWQMFDDAAESFPLAQTAVDLATLACALERYRLTNGEFPAALDALAPQFIAKLPHDVITGEPLKYRRTDGGGFALYSVGFNKTDDGGKPCVRYRDWRGQLENRFDLNQNDWVWMHPDRKPGLKSG